MSLSWPGVAPPTANSAILSRLLIYVKLIECFLRRSNLLVLSSVLLDHFNRLAWRLVEACPF